MEALPEKIQQDLSESYNGVGVVSWVLGRGEQEVVLANDVDLEFDVAGKFPKVD